VQPPQCHPPRLLPGEHWGPRLWGAGWSPRPEGEGATSQPGRRLSITVAFRMEENRGVEKPGMGGDAQQHRPCTGTAFLPFSRLGTSRGSLPPWGTNHRWPDRAMGSDMAHWCSKARSLRPSSWPCGGGTCRAGPHVPRCCSDGYKRWLSERLGWKMRALTPSRCLLPPFLVFSFPATKATVLVPTAVWGPWCRGLAAPGRSTSQLLPCSRRDAVLALNRPRSLSEWQKKNKSAARS